MELVFLVVLFLFVFPMLLLWVGRLIKTHVRQGSGTELPSVDKREFAEVPNWVQQPMKKWTW